MSTGKARAHTLAFRCYQIHERSQENFPATWRNTYMGRHMESEIPIKRAIQYAIQTGHSYPGILEKIETEAGGDFGWKTDSLRKFAIRENTPRINTKIQALAFALHKVSQESPTYAALLRQDTEALNALINLIKGFQKYSELDRTNKKSDTVNNDFTQRAGYFFRKLREDSKSISLKSKMAFLRYSSQAGQDTLAPSSERGRQSILLSLINIRISDNGYSIALKFREHSNRIAIGDVSVSNLNIQFQGISYESLGDLEEEHVFGLESFDLEKILEQTSRNPTGIETIVASRANIAKTFIPATFSGQNRSGCPIAGSGILISSAAFSQLGLVENGEDIFSEGEDDHWALNERSAKKLNGLLEIFKSKTIQLMDNVSPETNLKIKSCLLDDRV